jgi:small nuclear ribonucleoprotein (snRNP)-like protein
MEFDVVVSMNNAVPNGHHDFALTAMNVYKGSFSGTPVTLGSLVTTNYGVGKIENVKIKVPSTTLNAGDTNKEIVEVEMKPTEDAIVNSITITSDKYDLNKSIANLKAYVDGKEVGEVVVNDDTIVVKNLNLEKARNKTITLKVKGDIVHIGGLEQFVLSIDDNHVNAVEKNSGERMSHDESAINSNSTLKVD